LNNAAIAAQYCRDRGARRVAILDVDVHHGNGTQGIFYRRADVFTVSLHGDPSAYYPFYFGYRDEIDSRNGGGFNYNHHWLSGPEMTNISMRFQRRLWRSGPTRRMY
jgi:acetoin utilization deacetylase AcuC-like enzyme